MLDTFTINHIKAVFSLVENGQGEAAKAKIAYCRKLIAHAEQKEYAKHMGAYAAAIGTKPSQGLMDSIAADCAAHGSN